MHNFQLVASIPEVIGAVVSDLQGTLLQSSGEIDAESIGAVVGYSTGLLASAGAELGLGHLGRFILAGPTRTCIVTIQHQELLGVYIDSSRPVANFEKKLDAILQR